MPTFNQVWMNETVLSGLQSSKTPNSQLKNRLIYPNLLRPHIWASNPGRLGSSWREMDKRHAEELPSWAACFSLLAVAGDDIGWVTLSCLLLENWILSIPLNIPGAQTTHYSTIQEPALLLLYLKTEISHLRFLHCFLHPAKNRKQISNLTTQTSGVTP